jgi:hypothetical protein
MEFVNAAIQLSVINFAMIMVNVKTAKLTRIVSGGIENIVYKKAGALNASAMINAHQIRSAFRMPAHNVPSIPTAQVQLIHVINNTLKHRH